MAGILLVVHSELGALGEVGGERAIVLLRGDGGGLDPLGQGHSVAQICPVSSSLPWSFWTWRG